MAAPARPGRILFAVGDKFGRRDLVDAVLMPSATISPGYGTMIVETKAGDEFQGILKQATDAGVQLMGADGRLVSIATADIKEQRAARFRSCRKDCRRVCRFRNSPISPNIWHVTAAGIHARQQSRHAQPDSANSRSP